jgi:hypothetical protein
MISRIRGRLGPAGFVLAIIALVAALAGGAYAASGGLSGKQKKEVEKIAKKYAGKPGATGPQGSAGAAGKDGGKGDTGAKGEKGDPGAKGDQGIQGIQGIPGKDGVIHPGETLPAEATETGVWQLVSIGGAEQTTSIGWPIPLEKADAEAVTTVSLTPGGAPTLSCPGNVGNPEAEPGFLCLYQSKLGTTTNFAPVSLELLETELSERPAEEGVSPTGALLFFEFNINAGKKITGSFAVTAPLAP